MTVCRLLTPLQDYCTNDGAGTFNINRYSSTLHTHRYASYYLPLDWDSSSLYAHDPMIMSAALSATAYTHACV